MVLPPDSGSNLDFALAYHRLGWWVFPGRSPLDLAQYRHALIAQGASAQEAAAKAERVCKHTFVVWRDRVAQGPAGRPTEAEICDWFEYEPARPVIVLTGPGCAGDGLQLLGVDVDPLKGGDPAPWSKPIEEGGPTLLACTPSGGLHAYHVLPAPDAPGGALVPSSEGKDGEGGRHHGLADGVDVRGKGGLLVAPSGEEATPGRRWLRRGAEAPTRFPVEEWRARIQAREGWRGAERDDFSRRAVIDPAGSGHEESSDPHVIPAEPALRAFAVACLEVAPDGTRNPRAKTLIGVLARSGGLAADVVAAALTLLRDSCERRGLPADITQSLEDGWEALLEHPSRSGRFALDVLRTWNSTRCSPPWPDDKVEDVARSLWRTASAREATRPSPEDRTEVEGPRGGVFDPPAAPVGEDDDGTVDGYITERGELVSRVTGKAVRTLTGEEVIECLLPTHRALYGRKEYREKLATPVLSCATLPPWQTITAGGIVEATDTPHGHGLGPQIDVAFAGGLRPGNVVVIGAKTAKAGKTALADQLISGLSLRSVATLARLRRGEKTKELIVVRFDFSEMSIGDLTDRELGRWLGIDSTVFRRGGEAHLAPGVLRRAPELHLTPEQLAQLVLEAGEVALEEGTLADMRELKIMPLLEGLPGRSDLQGGDRFSKPQSHQTGALLVRRMVALTRAYLKRLAALWKVPLEQLCPLWLFDPIQRFQASGEGDAVGALDEFGTALKKAAVDLKGIIVCTADTNKGEATGSSTGGKPDQRNQGAKVAATLRGSYGLTHVADLTLMLAVDDETEEPAPGKPVKVRLVTGANRWLRRPISIPLWFDPETGRYTPRPEDEPPPADVIDPGPPEEDAPPSLYERLIEEGLTPTVAEVVIPFFGGQAVHEIAEARGRDRTTVAKQLRAAREILGVSNDDGLRALLRGWEGASM